MGVFKEELGRVRYGEEKRKKWLEIFVFGVVFENDRGNEVWWYLLVLSY